MGATWIGTAEAGELIGCCQKTVGRLVRANKIIARRESVRSPWRVRLDSVIRHVERTTFRRDDSDLYVAPLDEEPENEVYQTPTADYLDQLKARHDFREK